MDQKKTKRDLATSGTIVYVEWVDAVADVEWEDNVKAEIHPCKSIGWIVDETKDALCLACTVSMESSNARIHIPKAWIKNRKVIKVETKKASRAKKPKSEESTEVQDYFRQFR
jgi:hypothetical protein